MEQVLDFIVSNSFNAIRLPFSLAMALDLGKVNTQWLMDDGACVGIRVFTCGVVWGACMHRFDLCSKWMAAVL